MSEDATPPQQQQQAPAAAAAPPAGQADLLRQTEMLANQNKEREARIAELERKLQAEAEQNKVLAGSYMEQAKPHYEAYKAYFEESRKRAMDQKEVALYQNIYYNPLAKEAKSAADEEMRVYKEQQKQQVSIAASLEEVKKKLDAVEAERAEWKAMLAKAKEEGADRITTRAAYAAALDSNSTTVDEPARRSVALAAGADDSGMIPLPPVAPGLMPFLRDCNVTTAQRGEVVAGAYGDEQRYLAPVRSSVPSIPPNPIEYDPVTKERNFPLSWRYLHPGNMSWLTNLSGAPEMPTSALLNQGNGVTPMVEDKKRFFTETRYTPDHANAL